MLNASDTHHLSLLTAAVAFGFAMMEMTWVQRLAERRVAPFRWEIGAMGSVVVVMAAQILPPKLAIPINLSLALIVGTANVLSYARLRRARSAQEDTR